MVIIHLKQFGLTAISELVAHQTLCARCREHFCLPPNVNCCCLRESETAATIERSFSFCELRRTVNTVAEIEKMLNKRCSTRQIVIFFFSKMRHTVEHTLLVR